MNQGFSKTVRGGGEGGGVGGGVVACYLLPLP